MSNTKQRMDAAHLRTSRLQVVSPDSLAVAEGNQSEQQLHTPRTRRRIHLGKEQYNDRIRHRAGHGSRWMSMPLKCRPL
eukprot:2727964-Amphidinium_carterae.2